VVERRLTVALRSTVAGLRKVLPTKHPVRVRTTGMSEIDFGECHFVDRKNPYFLIRINSNLSPDAGTLVLVHEYAHAMAWDCEGEDHSIGWAECYSKAWRVFSGETCAN